jgi:hypothetical protein
MCLVASCSLFLPSWANESKNVEIEIGNFSRLKPPISDLNGAVGINFTNQGHKTTIVPLGWLNMGRRGKSPLVVSPDTRVWCVSGTVKYFWRDSFGNKVLEGESPLNNDWLTLKKKAVATKGVVIKIPDKPGRYKFSLQFDNTIIDKYGYNKSSYRPELYSTFKSEVEEFVEVKDFEEVE